MLSESSSFAFARELLKSVSLGVITVFFVWLFVNFSHFTHKEYISEWFDDGFSEMRRDLEWDLQYRESWLEAFGLEDENYAGVSDSRIFLGKWLVVLSVGAVSGVIRHIYLYRKLRKRMLD